MNTKHTSGPWALYRDNDYIGIDHKDGKLRSVIARCNDSWLCSEHGGTSEANARLIALSPEMIALLKAWVGCYSLDDMIQVPDYVVKNFVNEARALLAKLREDL